MENLGNSCYMASALQVLFSLEPFQAQYLDTAGYHLENCTVNPSECFDCQVSKLIFGLYSGLYSQKKIRKLPKIEGKEQESEEYQDGVRPSSFKNFFGKGHHEFSSGKQQDVFDYLSYLLEKFERHEKLRNGRNPKEAFEFDLEARLQCTNCKYVKYKSQRTWYLPLCVPDWQNKKTEDTKCFMEESFQKFLSEELVELKCPICAINQNFVKTQRVANFPRYFFFIFERFVYDWVPLKLETQFVPEDKLDLKILNKDLRVEGEMLFPPELEEKTESTEEKEPEFNAEVLNMLIMNGVPEIAAKNCMLKTSMNDFEAAFNYFLTNIDNPELNNPIITKKSGASKSQVPEESIESLMSMGFSRKQCEGALRKCDNNVERALDYIFNHPDETFGK